MHIGSVFENNRTQAIRLPAEIRLPKGLKKVAIRVLGNSRIIEPISNSWDSFFLSQDGGVSEDFMTERASQIQQERETL